MKTNSSEKLIEILENKNISFNENCIGDKTLFKKYSYYQVINAYKLLFITDVENIDKIKENIGSNKNLKTYRKDFSIKSNISDSELFECICTTICNKYGIVAENIDDKLKFITKIDYHLHRYDNSPHYRDFVRMYKFEHELRLMLLKYVLIIEESIKNIFIKYLNDNSKSADYLVNMKNYNTSSFNNKAFDTMRLIIQKHNNDYSKPIKTKRRQELTIPYWILINELTMNETYTTIENLNSSDSLAIFTEATNFFTLSNIEIKKDKDGKIKISEKDKKLVSTFKSLLFYLGKFRNMLAHNQPIYTYNIEEYHINSDIKFVYEMPKTKKEFYDEKGNLLTKEEQQYKINGNIMRDLILFFGKDKYNGRNQKVNLNLSFIIYIISKVLNHIDKNNMFYEEITQIYRKYSLILVDKKVEVEDYNILQDYLNFIRNCKINDYDIPQLLMKIENGEAYSRELNRIIREYEALMITIKKSSEKIKINEQKSKYLPFKEFKRYTEFTGIDKNFFSIIK